jgi:lysophospholipase L1-like esterase
VALAVGLMVAGAVACGARPYWHGTRPDTAVAVVGDSYVGLLEVDPGTSSALTDALTREGWRAHVHGESGWPTARVRGLVEEAVDEGAVGLAIVAGVNDVAWSLHQPDEAAAVEAVAADVRAVLDASRSARCVVWPTVAPGPPSATRANRVVAVVNGVLRDAARTRPGVVVPEWGTRLRARPDWLGPDGLHLSAAGEEALRSLLVGELHACLDPPQLAPRVPPVPSPA